jgi:Family of unknown function (DUF6101)
MRSGGCPAGSGRALRLDPFALPVRFAASDAAADEHVREIELHRTRVVVRRQLAGMRMALNLPIAAFSGVGLRMMASESEAALAVVLAHQDPGLALPLFVSDEVDEVLAQWRSWGAVLGLPLLLEDEDGWHEPFARLGALRVGRVRPRRRRRSMLKRRRPSIPLRRARGKLTAHTPVHRGEHEIIARN